jgi:hypothetical protein
LVDATAGNITITLLVASGNSGKKFTVKKIDSTANTVTVTNSTNIDGATTKLTALNIQGKFQSNGTQYFIIEFLNYEKYTNITNTHNYYMLCQKHVVGLYKKI